MVFSIPLPKSGQIKKVHHISDLHIRSIDSVKRNEEYINVFERFIAFIRDNNKEEHSVVVVTGDIFHTKNKLCPLSIELFLDFVKKISAIMPLYVIIGNHDIRLDKPEVPDMVRPLLKFSHDNILYMDKTGYYCSDGCDVGFAVVPIDEMLDKGNTTGITRDLPVFPSATGFPDGIKHKIALSHASIPFTIPIEWFGEGYSYILLGDIHIQRVYNTVPIPVDQNVTDDIYHISRYKRHNKGAMWGYSGSMIQQNFGETVRGHGFIEWDLDNGYANTYHVRNDYGMINLINCEGEWIMKATSDNRYIKLKECIKHTWFPRQVMVRYLASDGDNIFQDCQDISNILKSVGIEGISIKSADIDTGLHDEFDKHEIEYDFSYINTPDSWVEYITEKQKIKNKVIPYKGWDQWFKDPMELLIENDVEIYEALLQEKIEEKNRKLQKEIENYNNVRDQDAKFGKNKRFDISSIHWNYILCFGCNCSLDFETLKGNVVCINGVNGTGKTSLLEIVCIAIFGEGFEYRTNKDYQSSIICQQKPSTSKAFTKIMFNLDNESYTITRNFSVLKTNNKLSFKDCVLKRESSQEILLKGKMAIADWVNNNIGTVDSFLMSCMITQEFDLNFFDMSLGDQKAKIDDALSLQSITAFKGLMHEFGNAYKNVVKDLELVHQGLLSKTGDYTTFDYDHMKKTRETVCNVKNEIAEIKGTIESKRIELNKKGVDYTILAMGKETIKKKIKQMYEIVNKDFNVCEELSSEELLEMKGKLLSNFESLKKYHDDNWGITTYNFNILPSRSIEVIENELLALDDVGVVCDMLDKLECSLTNAQNNRYQIKEQWDMHLCCKPVAPLDKNNEAIIPYNYTPFEIKKIIDEYNACKHLENAVFNASMNNDLQAMNNEYYNWICNVENDVGSDPSSSEFDVLYDMNIASVEENRNALRDIETKYNDLYKSKCELESMKKDCVWRMGYHVKFNHPDLKYCQGDYDTIDASELVVFDAANNLMQVLQYEEGQKGVDALRYKLDACIRDRDACCDYEFNHDCKACMNHPWRLKTIEIETNIGDYNLQIKNKLADMMDKGEYAVLKANLERNRIIVEKTLYDAYKKEKDELDIALKDVEKQVNKLTNEFESLERCRTEHATYIKNRSIKTEKMLAYKREYDAKYRLLEQCIKQGKQDLEDYERYVRANSLHNDVIAKRYQAWLEEEIALKQMIDDLDQDIEKYKDKIVNVLRYAQKKVLEEERDLWIAKYKTDALLCRKRLDACNKRIDALRIDKDIVVYENALLMYDDYISYEVTLVKTLEECEALYVRQKVELEQLVDAQKRYKRALEVMNKFIHNAKIANDIATSIAMIEEDLTDYNTWVFKTKAMPIVCGQVNGLLQLICRNHRDLELKCIFIEGTSRFNWFLHDGCNTVPFEKASGFQQFSLSLAMRIVMGKIAGVNMGQLFIDEGFSSFDADNLANVPDFLKELLDRCGYNMVMIVSHLEDLKDSCSKFISIERNDKKGVSMLKIV